MTAFGIDFDPDAIPDSDREFDLLPDGEVLAHPIESKMKVSDDNLKHTLEVTWELLDGPHAKRRFWQNLKIIHPTAICMEIDGRLLKKHFEVLGHTGRQASFDPLMFQPVRIKIGTEKGTNGYKDKNVVKDYAPASGSAVGAAGPATAAAASAKPATPWGQKAA